MEPSSAPKGRQRSYDPKPERAKDREEGLAMCPFCISALAVAAAKTLSAAGSGGALVAKLALKKRGNGNDSQKATPVQSHTPTDQPEAVSAALIAAAITSVEPLNLARN